MFLAQPKPQLNTLIGQISASLAAMNRTMDDYDSMAKREIIKAKQEKAMMYVRSSYSFFPMHSMHILDRILSC